MVHECGGAVPRISSVPLPSDHMHPRCPQNSTTLSCSNSTLPREGFTCEDYVAMEQEPEAEPKARKACSKSAPIVPSIKPPANAISVNCRRQKMKCRIDAGTTCRRCQRAGLPCISVPRPNASAVLAPSSLLLTEVPSLDAVTDIMRRVQLIEDHLGLSSAQEPQAQEKTTFTIDSQTYDESLGHIWKPLGCLDRCAPAPRQEILWRKSTIKYLWEW